MGLLVSDGVELLQREVLLCKNIQISASGG